MIKAPIWAKKAHPTKVGWVYKSELLICRKFTKEQIAEWEKHHAKPSVTPEVKPVTPKKKPVTPKVKKTNSKKSASKTGIDNYEHNNYPKPETITLFRRLLITLKRLFTRK